MAIIVTETQVSNNYSLVVGDDDGVSVSALLQWKDGNLLYHNITVVPDTPLDIRPDNVTINLLYSIRYNISVLHMCSGPNSIPLCIGLYYCES